MAYFEKEYLPHPDLDTPDKNEDSLMKQDEFKDDPIYLYTNGDIRYKLVMHRNQKTMLNFLKSEKVQVEKFIFCPERF